MTIASIPARIVGFGGSPDTNGITSLHGKNYTNANGLTQVPSSGNRCNHDKNSPKFAEGHEKLQSFPHIIKRAHSFLEASYYDPTEYWKSLNFLDDRKKRSERREACVKVGRVLNLHNNLKSFTVKMPAKDIAMITKLSISRVIQALRDLNRAGYIKTASLIKHCFKGAWYGITAIRQLTDKFYLELKVSEYAIVSAKCHKGGYKMDDTRGKRTTVNQVGELLMMPGGTQPNAVRQNYVKPDNNSYSSVNSKKFYQSNEPSLYPKSIADEIEQKAPNGDEAIDLVIKAKEEAAITGEPWTKVLRRLVNSPPST